jgi:HAE1 family hydrophobic/amphiphilic exporter-1
LCSRFLRERREGHGRFFTATERAFLGIRRIYGQSLTWVLQHRPAMLAVFVAIIGVTGYLFVVVPKGFIPDTDQDQFNINLQAQQGTSYYQSVRYLQEVARVVVEDPDVISMFSRTGGGGASGNAGFLSVNLKPRRQRKATVTDIVNRLRPRVSNFTGLRAAMQIPQSIRIGGRNSQAAYDYTLYGPDIDELYRAAPKMEQIMTRLPGLVDVISDLQIKNPQIEVEVDRDRAAALQVNWNNIAGTLYNAFGPQLVSTIYGNNNQYRVLLEILPEYQRYEDSLKLIHLKSDTGHLVPLDAIAHLRLDAGPTSIPHSGQMPSVTISFGTRPGFSLGQATDEIEEAARSSLPATITGTFQGSAKLFQESMHNMGLLLLIAVLVVYIVLGVLYESYIQPLTILSGLPSAGFGALMTLLLFKIELSIYSFVGLIMLIGLVLKNAIMQVDFAVEAQRTGQSPTEAVYQACIIRFRPILMTTLAALLGGLPVALGYGAGGETRKPLGAAVVGGLAFSQLMTLYLTPVVYTYMAGMLDRWRAVRPTRPALEQSAFNLPENEIP